MVGFGKATAQDAGFTATSGGVGQIALDAAGAVVAASADGRQLGRLVPGAAPEVMGPRRGGGPPAR
ncbi:MAG: hypothetical protein ACO3FX_08055, partial [Gemmobacter sp.]